MLSASRHDRQAVSTKLRNLLSDVGSEAAWICDEAVGCLDETLTTDRHQLEIVLMSQAAEFMALMAAYKAERERLKLYHDELAEEIDAHDRADTLGYGHFQRELL